MEPPGYVQITFVCIDYKIAEKTLTEQHNEKLKMMAITEDESAIMEIWTDGKGGGWSLILHRTIPTNVRCLILSGDGIVEVKDFQEKGLAN